MPTIKDGPMACSKTSMVAYTHELKNLRSACMRYLEEHDKAHPDQIWSEKDGEGRPATSDKDKARFKLVTKVPFKDGKPVFPPANTRLSDELVYLATKFLKLKDRARDYSYDFLPSGDINPGRVPSGVGPIIFAHGLPFFPVFKGYYILCGRQHVSWVGWMLHEKEFRLIKGYPIWTIGPVVAPGSAVALERTVERQLRVHKAMSMRDVAKGEEKAASTRDVVSSFHNHGSVVPKTTAGGFIIAPLYQVPGYSVHCGPKSEAEDKADTVSRDFFKENRIDEFKYNDSFHSRYVNQRNPRVLYSDEEDDEEEEEEEEKEEEEDSDESMVTGQNDKAQGKRGLEEGADEDETELEGEGDDRAHKKIKTTIHLHVNAEEPDAPVTENSEAADHTQTADKVTDVADQPMEDIDAKETTDTASIQSTMEVSTKTSAETTTENETATEPATEPGTETWVQTTDQTTTETTAAMDVDTTETTAQTTDEAITETAAETATEAITVNTTTMDVDTTETTVQTTEQTVTETTTETITVNTTTMDVDTTETKQITEPQHESPGIISTTDVETNTDPETCNTRNTSEALEDAGDKMVEN